MGFNATSTKADPAIANYKDPTIPETTIRGLGEKLTWFDGDFKEASRVLKDLVNATGPTDLPTSATRWPRSRSKSSLGKSPINARETFAPPNW